MGPTALNANKNPQGEGGPLGVLLATINAHHVVPSAEFLKHFVSIHLDIVVFSSKMSSVSWLMGMIRDDFGDNIVIWCYWCVNYGKMLINQMVGLLMNCFVQYMWCCEILLEYNKIICIILRRGGINSCGSGRY